MCCEDEGLWASRGLCCHLKGHRPETAHSGGGLAHSQTLKTRVQPLHSTCENSAPWGEGRTALVLQLASPAASPGPRPRSGAHTLPSGNQYGNLSALRPALSLLSDTSQGQNFLSK